jgi:hypothetical protein
MPVTGGVMVKPKSDDYILMRCKIGQVFEHYAKESEYYKRANVVQRLVMEDSFYHLSMELLARIIGPFEVMR